MNLAGNFSNLTVILAISIAAIIGLAYFIYIRLQKQRDHAEIQHDKPTKGGLIKGEPEPIVPVAILDDSGMPPRLRYDTMPYSEIKAIADREGGIDRVWTRSDKRLYALYQNIDGFSLLKQTYNRSHSPRILYDDTQLPEIEITHDMSEDKNFIEKYGMILWWVAVMAFIMFLWVNA